MWQYISVINTVANAYVWDNMYHYDIIFRQLMQFNPTCSWAVTYNHMWNLSIKEPLSKNNFRTYGNNHSNNVTEGITGTNLGSRVASTKRKSDYCWNFNKGVKCRFGAKCKFIEHCSYCDSPSHGIVSCNKLDKKESGPPKRDSKWGVVINNKLLVIYTRYSYNYFIDFCSCSVSTKFQPYRHSNTC